MWQRRKKGTFYEQYTSRVSLNHFQDKKRVVALFVYRVLFSTRGCAGFGRTTADLAASSVALQNALASATARRPLVERLSVYFPLTPFTHLLQNHHAKLFVCVLCRHHQTDPYTLREVATLIRSSYLRSLNSVIHSSVGLYTSYSYSLVLWVIIRTVHRQPSLNCVAVGWRYSNSNIEIMRECL